MDGLSVGWRESHPFLARIEGDLIYAGLLLLCAALAYYFRHPDRYVVRRQFDGCIGLLITLLVARNAALYSFLIVLAHIALIKCVKDPKTLSDASFYGTFGYLAFLRVAHFFGLPKLEFITNAIQLIMTLRVIGLSYEIADAYEAAAEKKKDSTDTKPVKRFISVPNTAQVFNYCYSFTGLFTGPYFTYATYDDAVKAGYLTQVPAWFLISKKLKILSWSLPGLIVLYALGPVEVLKDEKVSTYNFFTLTVVAGLAFVYLRLRIYTAWMIAESICILSNIGIYPKECDAQPGGGPRNIEALQRLSGRLDIEYSDATIDNLDIPHVEASDGFRSGMRAWNRSVQFWLANFVYKRTERSIRMPYTMFVSAFWHGIHPGYFLSFLTIPLCTYAEDIVFRMVPTNPTTAKKPLWFRITWGFIRQRGFDLMACGFLLLTWTDTIRLWSGVYWWLHALMIVIAFAENFVFIPKKREEKNE